MSDELATKNTKAARKPEGSLQPHHGSFPLHLFFTYEFNFLESAIDTLTPEEHVLHDNVLRIIDMSPAHNVTFMDNLNCLLEISSLPPPLNYGVAKQFLRTQRGMIKADICRGAALYNHGGWYLDVDVDMIHPLHNLENKIGKLYSFVSVVPAYEPSVAIFQAIIGCTKNHPILLQYLKGFARNTIEDTITATRNTGTYIMKDAIQDIKGTYLLQESRLVDFKYNKQGLRETKKGYWCDNVIYDPHSDDKDVYFYSRIPGSRMC